MRNQNDIAGWADRAVSTKEWQSQTMTRESATRSAKETGPDRADCGTWIFIIMFAKFTWESLSSYSLSQNTY